MPRRILVRKRLRNTTLAIVVLRRNTKKGIKPLILELGYYYIVGTVENTNKAIHLLNWATIT